MLARYPKFLGKMLKFAYKFVFEEKAVSSLKLNAKVRRPSISWRWGRKGVEKIMRHVGIRGLSVSVQKEKLRSFTRHGNCHM
jgi:hypothetical protein